MKEQRLKNYAASVRDRLSNIAHEREEQLQSVMVRFALERLMYRIGKSQEAEEFVLKGAMLFNLWEGSPLRPTKDMDLLGFGPASPDRLAAFFRKLCEETIVQEGLIFDPTSVTAESIREGKEYEGIRVLIRASLGNAKIPLQVDIGFGDQVIPAPQVVEYPTILEHPEPRVRVYSMLTVVAEKFQIMVDLGLPNSRMKDYFDLFALSRKHAFAGNELAEAIKATFERRGTSLPAECPEGLSDAFASDEQKQRQWQAFVRKFGPGKLEMELTVVVESLREFLLPVAEAIRGGREFTQTWKPGGPWRGEET